MSKLDDLMVKYQSDLTNTGKKSAVDATLLASIAKSLGPSIYNRDSSLVACSDKDEMERVKKNFLMGRLGLADGPELDAAIKEVCSEYKERDKQRVVFYYMLAKKFGKKL